MEYLPEVSTRNPTNTGSGSYINESERNLHVWCSIIEECTNDCKELKDKPTLGLLAGCYVRDEGPRRVSVSMLYAWLEMIIDLPLKDTAKFALFLIPVDPRLGTKSFPIGDIPIHPHALPVLRSDGNETVKEGHYMIYKIDNRLNEYISIWPPLIEGHFKRRSSSPSQTCTPSLGNTPSGRPPRNTRTRIAVRMRDRRCLVTGQAAVHRTRGGNFTGLEVAHIFPLMGTGPNRMEWAILSESEKPLIRNRQFADQPHNAMLLRADIHSLFDDYQWSVWPVQGVSSTYRIVRFEKSGATVLDEISSNTVKIGGPSLSSTESCSKELLRVHFRIALLIHFRGFGKRAVAGFNATLL